MSVTEEIKARIDAVDIISQTVKLRRSGRTYTGLCPFHAHKNFTPSFVVWADTGTWRCFGQCNEGGDIFKFVMKRDGLDFPGALQQLAVLAGVELKPRTRDQVEQDDNLSRQRDVLQSAAVYYNHLLLNAGQAEHARQHLAGRGLGQTAVEMFELGYSLDSWDAGLKYLQSKGYTLDDLRGAGLIIEKEGGKLFDRFRDRLMIPVRDELGRMTGFQARALKPDALPKFMNSPTTALFDKGRTVFGLHLARKPLRELNEAIVVEGNLDVIAAHQAGFTNVVSSQGTALTEHQLRLIKKHAKRILLALDADEAGDKATLRGLSVARESLEREDQVGFDPHGLIKQEARLGVDIRVMTLPDGEDPDDVINRDPEEWRKRAAEAEPVVAYVMRVIARGKDLEDAKVKVEIANAVLPYIEDVSDAIERDAYRQKLARLLKVDVSVLNRRPAAEATRRDARPVLQSGKLPARPAPAAAGRRETPAGGEVSRLETHVLGALLREPDNVYRIDRALKDLGLGKLSSDDFAATDLQLVFDQLVGALAQVEVDLPTYLRTHLAEPLWPTLDTLTQVPVEVSEARAGKEEEALLGAALRMRRQALNVRCSEARFLLEAAREQADTGQMERFTQEVVDRTSELARVDRALAPGALTRTRLGGTASPRRA
ncbi:MAG: DNA primase [Anaerolineales bacterium]|nr:DNA primase [Anaerolineales bacterium]